MAWRPWGSSRPSDGDLDAGLAALRTSFTLARRVGSVEDVVRAAANLMYLLCTAGRFSEALEAARDGRARPCAPWTRRPALTAVLDNNTAAVLIATGQWAEADELLTELIRESAAERHSATCSSRSWNWPSAGARASARQNWPRRWRSRPRSRGSPARLRACLAEQALYAGDLAHGRWRGCRRARGAAAAPPWPEEEIRLLAAGARVAADLAALPAPARAAGIPSPVDAGRREPSPSGPPAIAGQHGGGQPEMAALGALAAAEHARQHGPDDRRTWRRVADAGGRRASPTGRRTRGCARPRPPPGPDGESRPPARAGRMREPGSAGFRRRRCSPSRGNWRATGQADDAARVARPSSSLLSHDSTSPPGRRTCLPCSTEGRQ